MNSLQREAHGHRGVSLPVSQSRHKLSVFSVNRFLLALWALPARTQTPDPEPPGPPPDPQRQWGSFGSASIRAWSVSTETGFTFDRIRFHPRPTLRADVYSGDGNSANQSLGTFNSLFPRGCYFTPKMVPTFGPQNLIGLHPLIQFQRGPNITAEFAWDCIGENQPTTGSTPLEAES